MSKKYIWDITDSNFCKLWLVQNSSLELYHSFHPHFAVAETRENGIIFAFEKAKEKLVQEYVSEQIPLFDDIMAKLPGTENQLVSGAFARALSAIVENAIMGWVPRDRIELEFANGYFYRNDINRSDKVSSEPDNSHLLVLLRDDVHYWLGKEIRRYFVGSPVKVMGIFSASLARALGVLAGYLNEVEKRQLVLEGEQKVVFIEKQREDILITKIIYDFTTHRIVIKSIQSANDQQFSQRIKSNQWSLEGLDAVFFSGLTGREEKLLEENKLKYSNKVDLVVTLENQNENLAVTGLQFYQQLLNGTNQNSGIREAKSIEFPVYQAMDIKAGPLDQAGEIIFHVDSRTESRPAFKAFKNSGNHHYIQLQVALSESLYADLYLLRSEFIELPQDEYWILEQNIVENNGKSRLGLKINAGKQMVKSMEMELPRYFY